VVVRRDYVQNEGKYMFPVQAKQMDVNFGEWACQMCARMGEPALKGLKNDEDMVKTEWEVN
jgi:hypothetical protein